MHMRAEREQSDIRGSVQPILFCLFPLLVLKFKRRAFLEDPHKAKDTATVMVSDLPIYRTDIDPKRDNTGLTKSAGLFNP